MNMFLMKLKNHIDTKVMVSSAAGVALFGAAIWAAKKTGVSPVKKVAKVAQGGGK